MIKVLGVGEDKRGHEHLHHHKWFERRFGFCTVRISYYFHVPVDRWGASSIWLWEETTPWIAGCRTAWGEEFRNRRIAVQDLVIQYYPEKILCLSSVWEQVQKKIDPCFPQQPFFILIFWIKVYPYFMLKGREG
jgi:hypothetical protein